MLRWVQRLENIANWFVQKYYLLGALTIAAAVVIVLFDTQLQFVYHSSSRWIKSIGKGLGDLSANITLFAFGYYLLREAYVALVKRKFSIKYEFVPYIKHLLTILRVFHPLAGVLAISSAIMHGYILWVIAGGLNGGLAITSGLITLMAALLLGCSGWGIQQKRDSAFIRQMHKVIALLAVVVYALHKVAVD